MIWNECIFGNEEAQRINASLSGRMGFPKVKPPPLWSDHTRAVVKHILVTHWQTYRSTWWDLAYKQGHDPRIVHQVVACQIMACGAPMPPYFREQAIQAGRDDEWYQKELEYANQGSEGPFRRTAVIIEYLTAVENYRDGEIVNVSHVSLEEATNDLLDAQLDEIVDDCEPEFEVWE